jgi:hypothetical protein
MVGVAVAGMVAEGVGLVSSVGVVDAVLVAADVGDGVPVSVGTLVDGVPDSVAEAVGEDVVVVVAVAVSAGSYVTVGVGLVVADGVAVATGVRLGDGVSLGVGVWVGVGVFVSVAVRVAEGVRVGVVVAVAGSVIVAVGSGSGDHGPPGVGLPGPQSDAASLSLSAAFLESDWPSGRSGQLGLNALVSEP